MYFARPLCIMATLFLLTGCGDNLFPSGKDKRPAVEEGSVGTSGGQKAPDFSVTDINGNTVTLSSALASKKGIVFYFTMWCPICDTHMSNMRRAIPSFPNIGFYLVDYVSGTVSATQRSASENGYATGQFSVLADTDNSLLNSFQATMGTTVVIDANGIVKMNEDYRDGSGMLAAISALQ
jgi:peroxiredoxin